MDTVVKLNGPEELSSFDPFCRSALNDGLVGLRRFGSNPPFRPRGEEENESFNGDRESRLLFAGEAVRREGSGVLGEGEWSEGGVGDRGGIGIGRLEAIVVSEAIAKPFTDYSSLW